MDNVIGSEREQVEFDVASVDFPGIQQRFEAVNTARLKRTRATLRERQRVFLDLLPLLFEVNHPMLPGYVSGQTPAGISGYQPDAEALHLARRLTRSFKYRKPMRGTFPIYAIYLMGSPGTVAYSENSDFDVWLCHDPALDDEAIEQLQQKALGIERWAASLDLEVHFFLINTDTLRSGETKALSSESSGSAQQNLLLEEFYRTSVLVAGRFPLWWLVPPEFETDYDAFTASLRERRFKPALEALDFGGLAHVPAEEFFGAAVWQLSKGIDSPYKAALKLLLIEAYASEYPYIQLLSLRFKQRVYDGEENLDSLDPYLMMLDKVEEYLHGRNEPERLELARRCFYFKVNDRLSADGSEEGWRRHLLFERVRGWGWGRGDLALMDNRDHWKVQRVGEERRTLFEALAASYRFLSDFARRYAGMAMISQRDLTILGRKLYSAYERKAGKIELLNRGIANDLHESHLTIHEAFDENRQPVWILYSGVVTPERVRSETPLKRMRSLAELSAWCHFNDLLDKNTAVAIYQRGSGIMAKDFNTVVQHLRSVFPLEDFAASSIEEFGRPARLEQAILFVNVGIKESDRLLLAKETGKAGSSDALSFGINGDNLLISVDQVVVTSWHEVMTHRYSGAKGLMECLRDYLKWTPPSSGQIPPQVTVHGLSAYKGLTVSHRLQELFNDVVTCYYGGKNPLTTRYVLASAHGFFVLQFEDDSLRYKALESMAGLIRYLGRPQPAFSPVVIDRHALRRTVLPLIYSRNKPGYVQFFYRAHGSEVELFVLDERGSLFYQRNGFFSSATLLNQYSRFFEAVLNRMNFLMQDGETMSPAEGVEFYAINRDAIGNLFLDRKSPDFAPHESQYFSLQVMVDVDEDDKSVFTLYCNDQEFSTLEHGNGLFNAVVDYVLELRKSGKAYPIFITDISFARQLFGEQGPSRMQTVQFLNYKQRIEEQLNRAMRQHD